MTTRFETAEPHAPVAAPDAAPSATAAGVAAPSRDGRAVALCCAFGATWLVLLALLVLPRRAESAGSRAAAPPAPDVRGASGHADAPIYGAADR